MRRRLSYGFIIIFLCTFCFYNIYGQENEKDIYVWFHKGMALARLKNFGEAIICFDKAIELNPKDDIAWGCKGGCLYELGKYKEALICVEKSLQLNPASTASNKLKQDISKKMATAEVK